MLSDPPLGGRLLK